MVNDAAEGLGLRQKLLMRVHKPGDVFFPGQEGGFREPELIAAAREIQALPNVEITGVTTFPVLSYEFGADKEQSFNPNMGTIMAAAQRLRDEPGVEITMINAPGNTSTATLAMLAEGGATCVEPGHGLLRHLLPQINEPGHPEIPTYVFVSEVSHHHEGQAYGIAGGALWADMGGFMNKDWKHGGLVGTSRKRRSANRMDYRHLDQIIDYHIPLIPGDRASDRRHRRFPDLHPGAHDPRLCRAGQRDLNRQTRASAASSTHPPPCSTATTTPSTPAKSCASSTSSSKNIQGNRRLSDDRLVYRTAPEPQNGACPSVAGAHGPRPGLVAKAPRVNDQDCPEIGRMPCAPTTVGEFRRCGGIPWRMARGHRARGAALLVRRDQIRSGLAMPSLVRATRRRFDPARVATSSRCLGRHPAGNLRFVSRAERRRTRSRFRRDRGR